MTNHAGPTYTSDHHASASRAAPHRVEPKPTARAEPRTEVRAEARAEAKPAEAKCVEPTPGIELRDWIAGQVIAAMISSDAQFSGMRDKNGQHCELDKNKLHNMAKNSYQAADAMLEVRATAKKPGAR